MADLLARFADCAFWLGRYMERAENLARIIDVNETFSQDRYNAEDWLPIVEINADTERFFAAHDEASVEAVVEFSVFDRDNPTSIISTVRAARENARMLRHLISTEMWTHLNVFHAALSQAAGGPVPLRDLSRLCDTIKERCQTHVGIADGTLYRDQVRSFHGLGRCIERADQTTRLLDIKYHRLLPAAAAVGSPLDVGQWNAILRSAAGYHAFRREHPRGLSPATVAGFLLFNRSFPRSVAASVGEAAAHLESLAADHGLHGAHAPAAALAAWRDALAGEAIDPVIARGLHEYLDGVQQRLISLTQDLGALFFGHGAPAPT